MPNVMSDQTTPSSDGQPANHGAIARVQQLFVRDQGIIKAFIFSLHSGFSDADDVLQETFLLITSRAGTYREGTNFVAWACTIARFKLLEARRKATAPILSEDAMTALCDDAPDDRFFQERLPDLRECMRRLAPRARELVWHRYHRELASEEIARRLGWKEPAVRVALSKARLFLRTCVQRQLPRE